MGWELPVLGAGPGTFCYVAALCASPVTTAWEPCRLRGRAQNLSDLFPDVF